MSAIVDGLQVRETAVMVGDAAALMAILAVPCFVESAVEVAFTLSEPDVGTVDGAVYRPEPEMVPETADQVTLELYAPVPATEAEHWVV